MKLAEMDFCVIDTETTGGRAETNRVIDVAVFHVRGGEILGRFETLINPERPIPIWITGLTGISDEMVKQAPTFQEIASDLGAFLDRGVFAAHNVPFDYGFISWEYKRLGKEFMRPQFCTLKLARKIYPELPSRSLGILCEHLLIDIWDRHRARADAEATVPVLKEILRELGKRGVSTWEELQLFLTPPKKSSPKGVNKLTPTKPILSDEETDKLQSCSPILKNVR